MLNRNKFMINKSPRNLLFNQILEEANKKKEKEKEKDPCEDSNRNAITNASRTRSMTAMI